jgi:YidC/Oxa1 family membrane protein insertase
MGDIRNFMSGYLNPSYDPKRKIVFADKGIVVRRDMLQKGRPLWPTKDAPAGAELVWISALNRYFAAAVHPTAAASAAGPVQTLQQTLPVVGFQTLGFPSGTPDHDTQRVVITAATRAMAVQPGQSADLSLSLYAGPRKGEIFHAAPYDALGMEQLVRYELGCTWCTFQFLAHWLLAFLKGIHALLADWALAIIILVLVVRLILHPITKKAQINMTKMQRQMGQLQPEIEKLKKKYGDDQQKLNQEMMALYRDKGVNFTGALGCLPMFLQMPIWIALYAMLYFAIELRHEPAFYGFFQWITAGKWSFLADLAAPDHFIVFFDTPKPIHLLIINLDYSALNILPILMGITYWFQQQMMTPPPANEQMAQQQKMMKWMMLLFPFMLYSMPSGLTLYMLVSSWAGMLDSWVVKRHIAQQEAAGTLLDQAKPKQPGRLGLWLASKQKELEEKAKSAQRNPPPRKR